MEMTSAEWRKKFIIERQGKEVVLYQGLLDLAHDKGLQAIRTQFHQIPDESNGHVAICTAEVTMKENRVFTGIGDASPQNVSPAMRTCLLRMAETRAKARALRDATNIGVAAFEELSDDEPPTNRQNSSQNGTQRQETAKTQEDTKTRDKEALLAFSRHARQMGWNGTTGEHIADLVGLLLRRAPDNWGAETFLEARRVNDAVFAECVAHANKDIESPALILTEAPDTTREAMAR